VLASVEQHDQRKRLLAEAHRARNRGRERRAISLYRRILREDPRNAEVALRLAPLLARRGESFEAWQLYRSAARELARQKRYKDCLGVYRESCRALPHEFEAWRLRAELELKLGHEDAAYETLLDARAHFRDAHSRAHAIELLTRARVIEPCDPEVVLDHARLYARSDQADAALELLSSLAIRTQAGAQRRIRGLQWRITLSFRHAWLWLNSIWDEWFLPKEKPASLSSFETEFQSYDSFELPPAAPAPEAAAPARLESARTTALR